MPTEYSIQRLGVLGDDEPWKIRVEGAILRLSGAGQEISLDLRRESYRIRISAAEIVIDMMRFSASPQILQALEELLQVSRPRTSALAQSRQCGYGGSSAGTHEASGAGKVPSATDGTGARRNVGFALSSERRKTNYAAKLGSVGVVAGLVIMFLLPSGGGILLSAMIGGICGAGGYGLGYAFGTFLDALASGSASASGSGGGSSTLSVLAFVLGIVGLVAWIFPIAGIVIGIGGFVCGRKGTSSSQRRLGLTGMGISLVCLVLSVVNGLLGVLAAMRFK